MAFQPVDYYYLASWLYEQQTSHEEAKNRSIISKAYYSAFLAARDKAGITDKKSAVHKKVCEYYSQNPPNSDFANRLAFANRLKDSRINRNKADYDTESKITSRDSKVALAKCKRILSDLGFTIA